MAGAPRAVVIGLASVIGLQTARILSDRGVGVIGIAGDRRHFGARTRVCEQIIEADVHGEGFLEVLEKIGPDLDEPVVLYPCTDQAVLLVSSHRDRLDAWYHIILPPDDVVQTLTQKAKFYPFAQQHGLPVPATFTLHDRADAERAAQVMPYPGLLKPSVKTRAWKRNSGVKVWPVSGPAEMLAAYDRLAPWADALVAQQYIEGTDDHLYTCNCYYGSDNQALITFVSPARPASGRRTWAPPR